MLRICKVYNIVEKAVIIFGQLVMIIMMERVYQLYRRRHCVSEEEAMSVELAYGLMAIGVLLTAREFSAELNIPKKKSEIRCFFTVYLIFRNWMIDGTIASIKEDLYVLNRDKYVMQYNCEA